MKFPRSAENIIVGFTSRYELIANFRSSNVLPGLLREIRVFKLEDSVELEVQEKLNKSGRQGQEAEDTCK